MMVVFAGCAADPAEPTPSGDDEPTLMDTERPATAMDGGEDTGPDVCSMAAELPADDICRHLCDPQALADQLAADGAQAGACYQLYCQLTPTAYAIAGVCLAP